MKIAVIPDIHQTNHWTKIVPHVDLFDRIIFLGDIFDAWDNRWPEQMDNARAIIEFKRNNPEKVDLCWGNHDASYYLEDMCSGYQHDHAVDITDFFMETQNLFSVVYEYDKGLFCHGGVSREWMKLAEINNISEINELFRMKPNFFGWFGPDAYGNNIKEGPLWIRPEALRSSAVKGYNMIVGHTETFEAPFLITNDRHNIIICIDSPRHDCITELDTKSNKWNKLEVK